MCPFRAQDAPHCVFYHAEHDAAGSLAQFPLESRKLAPGNARGAERPHRRAPNPAAPRRSSRKDAPANVLDHAEHVAVGSLAQIAIKTAQVRPRQRRGRAFTAFRRRSEPTKSRNDTPTGFPASCCTG